MSHEKRKAPSQAANKPAAAAHPASPAPSSKKQDNPLPTSAQVPNLFRRWDWVTFGIATLLVLIGYIWTLAPDVTLEDSGELAVASHYAGVPHPPGYPVWTIYTWLFTVLIPISNIAWRVALSSAVAGALSCGLVGLLVSRGSSLLFEGIEEFRGLSREKEKWITMVAGTAAGLLLGFNGFMWSQAVIVEVYTFSVLSLVGVLCFLLRWVYAPHQRRYLYYAAFTFGICLNNHQTLIVATMGIEVLIIMVQPKLGRDLLLINVVGYVLGLIGRSKGLMLENPMVLAIFHAVGLGSIAGAGYLVMKTQKVFTEWRAVLVLAAGFILGLLFYFYMPLASMTNPPLNWGYPRHETGFWHAITRGQYDKTSPTNVFSFRFIEQVGMYIEGAIEEFNLVNLVIGLLPFLFYKRLLKRDRAWLVGLTAIYLFLAFLLLILLNPNTDKTSSEQARVFFAASHVIIAIGIGYGLALIGSSMATQFARIREYLLYGAAIAAAVALYSLVDLKSEFPGDKYNAIFALALGLLAVVAFWTHRDKAPLPIILGIFAVMPIHSVLAHWADNEQRGHLFGYWFGHDMFEPPFDIYPSMATNAILFGGTDPGRFNPTYMIFSESQLSDSKKRNPKFDRRDVYLITQNALADGTYLDYIRAHYNRSAQEDPFFFVNFFRTSGEEAPPGAPQSQATTNAFAKMWLPVDRFFTKLGARIEKERRRDGVYPPIIPQPEPPPGAEEDPYDVGAWLSKEIYTPSLYDSQVAFQEYVTDAQRRLQHDMAFPNEPKQIKPGEDVRIVNGTISVSGQVAVMAINGLLTKVIFDRNPTNEFYVEESFPLDWMFPHLTPYGIIMKLNRDPVPEITEEMVRKDHEFWSEYSSRLIGDWITYDTPVEEICDFAIRVYRRRDFTNFKGDPKFVRDDNAQKAFSKLRSAIGGVYFWRISMSKNVAENQRMIKEAEFAFKQSLAYCPYSPEAVYKYVTLLINLNRHDEAIRIVETCIQFDQDNLAMHGLAQNIRDLKNVQGTTGLAPANAAAAQASTLQILEQQYRSNPTNLQVAFQMASAYLQAQRSNDAYLVLQKLIANTNADAQTIMSVANAYSQLGNAAALEGALHRLTETMPEHPEAWYDLARVQATLGKVPAALENLQKAVQLSNERLSTNPQANNIAKNAQTNQSLASLRNSPEFLRIVGE